MTYYQHDLALVQATAGPAFGNAGPCTTTPSVAVVKPRSPTPTCST